MEEGDEATKFGSQGGMQGGRGGGSTGGQGGQTGGSRTGGQQGGSTSRPGQPGRSGGSRTAEPAAIADHATFGNAFVARTCTRERFYAPRRASFGPFTSPNPAMLIARTKTGQSPSTGELAGSVSHDSTGLPATEETPAMETLHLRRKARLEQELIDLRRRRKMISERIGTARELGDLSENAEYHAAHEDQGHNEAEDPPARAAAVTCPRRRRRERSRRRRLHRRNREVARSSIPKMRTSTGSSASRLATSPSITSKSRRTLRWAWRR